MTGQLLHCGEATQLLTQILVEGVQCSREGDALVLDTPYVFGNGEFLRVYLYETPDGIVVTDGGFAAQRVELFSPEPATRQQLRRLERLAADHDLVYDGRLSFSESSLEDALYRLNKFALALHENELAFLRRQRPRAQTRELLRRQLAETHQIRTFADYDIVLPNLSQPVTVDLLALSADNSEAAIEFIEARTDSAVRAQVDRSSVNLSMLDRGKYQGGLITVFDEDVLQRDHAAIARLRQAKPDRAFVISSKEAARLVPQLLHAA